MSGTVRRIGGQTAVLLITTCVLSALDCTHARERVSVCSRREGGRLSERKKLEIQRVSERFRGAPETLTQGDRESIVAAIPAVDLVVEAVV